MEPSDGTRSLSVWASGAEILLKVLTNETDERRSVLHESRLPLSIALPLELDFGLIMGEGGGVIGSSAMSIKRALNTAGMIQRHSPYFRTPTAQMTRARKSKKFASGRESNIKGTWASGA